MIRFTLTPPPEFMWLGKESTLSENWIHYSRQLSEYELMIVDKGTLYISDDLGNYEVHSGEYILMPPCRHQYGWKPSACSFYWLHFHFGTPQDFSPFFSLPKKARIPDFSEIQTFLSQIYHNEQFYPDTTQSSFLLAALLLEIHNQLWQSAHHNSASQDNRVLPKAALCKKIKNYIFWNRTHCIKISEIAEYVRYSEKYISAVFSETTGIRLKTYIGEQQMEAAKELLSNSRNSIAEISFQLGYSDSHNFSRAFKRITGMSPSDYRISSGEHNTRP